MFKWLFLFAIIPLSVFSGNDPVVNGARETALSGAVYTLGSNNSIFHNQAGTAFIKNISGGVNYNNRFLVKNLATSSAFFLLPLKPGVVGVSFSSFGYELYNETTAGISLGKSFGDKFSAGMKIDWMSTRIAEGYGKKNYLIGQAGVIVKPNKKLSLGLHIYNPTMTKFAEHNNERIPTLLNLGLDYMIGEKVLLAAGVEKDLLNDANFKGAVEYKASDKLHIRGGFGTYPVSTSLGFGYKIDKITIDMASSWHNVLGFSPAASIIFEL